MLYAGFIYFEATYRISYMLCVQGFIYFPNQFLQGFAQNFSTNYSVQLRAFLLSPALQQNLRIFFADPDGGGGTLMEAAGIRLNLSATTVEKWRIRLQNYFQGNFRYTNF